MKSTDGSVKIPIGPNEFMKTMTLAYSGERFDGWRWNSNDEKTGVVFTKFTDGALTQKDVKNEGWSSEFIENKGAKKWSSEFIENK